MIPALSTTFIEKKRTCEIFIENGLLRSQFLLERCRAFNSQIAIVADANIEGIYGKGLLSFFLENNLKAHLFSIPAGEENKSRASKEHIENEMQNRGFKRNTLLLALGGGIASDLGGFIASTYMRGIPLFLLPTTLLAMVDASIGGKNGVNTSFGKNQIGTTYQPEAILMDLDTLRTLPKREIRNGLAEVIKHALIADVELFHFLEERFEDLLRLDERILKDIILKNIKIKLQIVEQDERENGIRVLLNFGHTFAHALESISNYELPHGEAVAIGSCAEVFLSYKMGLLDYPCFSRIVKMFKSFQFPLQIKRVDSNQIIAAMAYDKKTLGTPRFILLEKIGKAKDFGNAFCTSVENSLLEETIDWLYALHSH